MERRACDVGINSMAPVSFGGVLLHFHDGGERDAPALLAEHWPQGLKSGFVDRVHSPSPSRASPPPLRLDRYMNRIPMHLRSDLVGCNIPLTK